MCSHDLRQGQRPLPFRQTLQVVSVLGLLPAGLASGLVYDESQAND
jgi:hypothetical protein